MELIKWTGLRWMVDVHLIDNERMGDLRRMRDLGWLLLERTDTLQVETDGATRPGEAERLARLADEYPEALGPVVLDHSRLDHAVLGTKVDWAHIAAVYAAMWPTGDMASDAASRTRAGRARFRDSLHVATAIRYGRTGFITEDRGQWRAAERVAQEFDSFLILSVDAATLRSLEVVRRVRRSASMTGDPEPTSLPTWPT